jgi:UDP-N-acetylglucosamine--N-acetylmuramyl-(pentapeptide) pyrophosphoryl-undecaprenol N-acetylglucosamine transferase
MVLIPFRGSGTRGDQVENARLFQDAGAAVCLIPDSSASQKLLALIISLAEDSERRLAMGEAAVGTSDAAAFIAKEIANRIYSDRIYSDRIEERV